MTDDEKSYTIQIRCTEDTKLKWKHIVANFYSSEDAIRYYIDNYEKFSKNTPQGRVI